MKIFVEPLDVLFFRDGKPFVAGEAHRAESIFPPTAMTFQGAIRSKFIYDSGVSFEAFRGEDESAKGVVKAIGRPNGMDDYGDLLLQGPFIARRENAVVEDLFPLPADILFERDPVPGHSSPTVCRLEPSEDCPVQSDLDSRLKPVWPHPSKRVEGKGGFISKRAITDYLKGKVDSLEITATDDILFHELRPGLRMDTERRRPKTGQLYFGDFLRLKSNYGFTLSVEGIEISENGWLKLGGESRACWYEKIEPPPSPLSLPDGVASAIDKSRRFKLYIASPAFFKQGWLPGFISRDTLEGERGSVSIQLESVLTGKPLLLGGWDLANNQPKAMKRFVRSGSIYWFRLLKGTGKDVVREFHRQCISELGASIGFGLTFTGVS